MDKIKTFSLHVQDQLSYYVYCLVDPIDNKIFYIGKGKGNRVFEHDNDSRLTEITSTDSEENSKLGKIAEIQKNGKKVKHFIIRHGLSEIEALTIESVLINLLTFKDFNIQLSLKNIQHGYHQSLEGIKSVDEIEQMYNSDLDLTNCHEKLFIVKLNKSLQVNTDVDISEEEATRKWWRASKKRIEKADYLVGIYRGIVRTFYKIKKDNGKSKLEKSLINNYFRYGLVLDEHDDSNNKEFQEILNKYIGKRLIIANGSQHKGFMDCQSSFRYWNI